MKLKVMFGLALLAIAGAAQAATVELVAHNQRSSSGTLSTLVWDGSNLSNAWAIANGVQASNATWDWDGTTLTGSGLFWTTSHIGSNPNGAVVISDKVVDLTVNTATMTTTATSYECVEGNFLPLVGALGCANVNIGTNFIPETTVTYNVGGMANCVNRAIGGDDSSTGNPRGLMTAAAVTGCDAVDGAFDLWTIVQDDGSTLILSNGVPLTDPGTNYLTFQYAVVPVPAAAWLFGSALGLLGWVRRRAG